MEIIKDKDLMFSIISHDLKVPANNLRALTNLLISEDKLPKEEQTKITRMLYSSAQNHSQLVNNLLDWSNTDESSGSKEINDGCISNC
jgi:signal transduction histidine kinase